MKWKKESQRMWKRSRKKATGEAKRVKMEGGCFIICSKHNHQPTRRESGIQILFCSMNKISQNTEMKSEGMKWKRTTTQTGATPGRPGRKIATGEAKRVKMDGGCFIICSKHNQINPERMGIQILCVQWMKEISQNTEMKPEWMNKISHNYEIKDKNNNLS